MTDDINAVNGEGQTALILAAPKASPEEIQRLLDAGANPCHKDRHGLSAKARAQNLGRHDVVALLAEAENQAGCPDRTDSQENLEKQARLAFESSEAVKRLKREREAQEAALRREIAARAAEEERRRKQKEEEEAVVWFYSTDLEIREGPYSLLFMRRLLAEGSIQPETLVWCPNLPDWQCAREAIREPEYLDTNRHGDTPDALSTAFSRADPPSLSEVPAAVDRVVPATPPTAQSRATAQKNTIPNASRGVVGKLMHGDYGLATTYWGFHVLAAVAANISILAIPSESVAVVLAVLYTVYAIPVLIGIWAAANRYEGPNVWAILARIAAILGWIGVIGSLALALQLLHESA